MKRILIFSTTYEPYIGGAEIAVKNITDRISDIEFDMVTLRFDRTLPKEEKIGNVTVHRLGFTQKKPSIDKFIRYPLKFNKLVFPLVALRKALLLHRHHSYDAIWSIMASFAGYGAVLFKMVKPSVPFLLTLQEGDPIDFIKQRAGITYPLFKRIFSHADSIQVISTYLGTFAKDMGATVAPIVIPNAVDLDVFSKKISTQERERTRSEFNANKSETVIITTSRLVPKNGLDILIQATAELRKDCKLAIIGDGPELRSLRELISRLNIGGRVQLLGERPHAELPRYLQSADIFCRPSRSEGMGNSFIEAMAAGIPVVATRVGGITDFLFDPDFSSQPPTGLCAPVDDPEELAEQIARIRDDHELRETLIANASELVAKKYTWDLIAKRMRTESFASLWK